MDNQHQIPPKVFISYSHDTSEHKKWVLEFATTIRGRGVDAILDQWHSRPGDDLPHFMEAQLDQADYVLMICTEKYVEKANKGTGGVGYEKMIMTASLLSRIDSNKVIPIIRQHGTKNLPVFMATKKYIDFSIDEDVEYSLDELMKTLLGAPLFDVPPIGTNPFKPMSESRPDRTSDGVRQVISDVAVAFSGTSREYVEYQKVVEHTELSRLTLDMYVGEAIDEGLLQRHPNSFESIKVTPKGLIYLHEREMI